MDSPTVLSGQKAVHFWSISFLHKIVIGPYCLGMNLLKESQGWKNLLMISSWARTITLTSSQIWKKGPTHCLTHKLDWTSILFENSIAALKPFNAGNVMKIIKTLFNAWTTCSRIGGAHYIYPCTFGCNDCCDRLSHYLICPMLLTLCEFMHIDFSIHPADRWGLNPPW